jgi:hypothetical protein
VRLFLIPHGFPAADGLVGREAEMRDEMFLGGKPRKVRSIFAQDHIHRLDAECINPREIATTHAV